jgi:hypothetical protein
MRPNTINAMLLAAALAWAGSGPLLAAPRELTDAEMDAISGGSGEADPSGPSQNVQVSVAPVSTISLAGQAQQNLSALVNILAINSAVQVLLNVNVTLQSTVGSVTQSNSGLQ